MSGAVSSVYLVDGSGYVFRAFHALPQLSNSHGLPTNAIYGFTRMLVKLLKEARPSHIAIFFDSPKKTFRDDLFASYKANRAATPDDLQTQLPYIQRVVEAFRIRGVMVEGYEADDAIGTLATQAAKQKLETVIVTSDKDFKQLVGPNLTLWDTMSDKRTGVREVRERFGLEPRALIDVMALTGDPIDNVKGVPGVGEKTAIALIKEFGGIEGLLKNLDRVEQTPIRGAKKLGPLIAEHRDAILLARKLVTIDCAVPLPVKLEELEYRGIDPAAAADLLRELEFSSLLAELAPGEARQATSPDGAPSETRVAPADAPALAERMRKAARISLHLGQDTIGADLLTLCEDGSVYAVSADLISAFKPLLESAALPKTCHDLKTHLRRFGKRGISLAGVDFDTMLAGFLINPGRAEPSIEDLFHEHLAALGERATPGAEARMVASLREVLTDRLEADELGALFHEIELPLARVLAEMESAGIAVDAAALRAMSREFGEQLARLEKECFEAAGHQFNLNSPIQLRDVLFSELKLPAKGIKKTKSGYSTDVDSLTRLAEVHPLPRKLLEYRTLAKLKSTYVDALPELIDPATGRIHTSFHQALTATGRLSSTEPNLQNIPARSEEGRRIRRAFVARPGSLLLSADYSQIELRVLAHLSNDPVLIEAFKQGEDIHARTAAEVLGTAGKPDPEARRLAKVINFGIIYGMGPQRLAAELGIPLPEASEYIRRYFERLAGVSAYMDTCLAQARAKGFVTTMFGRRRYLPELNASQGGMRAQSERIAINTPIQGTAADLIKIAMVRLNQPLAGHKARMLLQVHDELLFEVDESAREGVTGLVKDVMEGVASLNVPLRVELKWGTDWAGLRA